MLSHDLYSTQHMIEACQFCYIIEHIICFTGEEEYEQEGQGYLNTGRVEKKKTDK